MRRGTCRYAKSPYLPLILDDVAIKNVSRNFFIKTFGRDTFWRFTSSVPAAVMMIRVGARLH